MSKSERGRMGYHAGIEAERSVARHYLRHGYQFAAHRFRGRGGEIDLVVRSAEQVVFVEVKQSRSHARAAERLLPNQMARLFEAASEFVAGEPAGGRATPKKTCRKQESPRGASPRAPSVAMVSQSPTSPAPAGPTPNGVRAEMSWAKVVAGRPPERVRPQRPDPGDLAVAPCEGSDEE